MNYSVPTCRLMCNFIRASKRSAVFAVESSPVARSKESPLQEHSSRSQRSWSSTRPHRLLMKTLRKSCNRLWIEPWRVELPSSLPIGWVPSETVSSSSSSTMERLLNLARTMSSVPTKNPTSISWRVAWKCDEIIRIWIKRPSQSKWMKFGN